MTATPDTKAARKAVITAAMDLAADVAENRLDPAELTAQLNAEARTLFGAVVGPHDPLWPLQLDVTRQMLAAGGVPADELSEWLAVARRREAVSSETGSETQPPEPDVSK
ncbi:flagellar hook-length control protein [Gordonia sp. L191]|uniref:flagellar hook-length control protein n=1 Tax=Gordonia sp. L191 TaxID=2982699 RepID=UPI0024BF4C59|nr:flagellar hook-length control protein [Gordonia sp. L191]WHU48668.1 flagellar hook-length control protein [Gordonia sp. L191]